MPAWAHEASLHRGHESTPAQPGYVTAESVRVGEELTLDIAMTPRVTRPDDRIDAVRGCVAFERGPEVFALESVDLPSGWELADVVLDAMTTEWAGDTISVGVRRRSRSTDRDWPFSPNLDDHVEPERASVNLVRYHAWAARGPSTMRIWIPVDQRA